MESVRSILYGGNSGIYHILCGDAAHFDDWISDINDIYAGYRSVDFFERQQVRKMETKERAINLEKKLRITRIMLNILNIAPIIGVTIFAVLFSIVLTDRLEERILHSATTFFMWIFASMLYIMVLLHFKEFRKMILSAVGMVVFILMAVMITPLDRYVSLIYDRTHLGSYVLVGLMLVAYFVISIVWRKKVEGRYKYIPGN